MVNEIGFYKSRRSQKLERVSKTPADLRSPIVRTMRMRAKNQNITDPEQLDDEIK